MAAVVVELMTVDREQMEVLVVAAWVVLVSRVEQEIHHLHLRHKEIMVEPEILFHRDVQLVEVAVEQMR
jgi:hypothetical protein